MLLPSLRFLFNQKKNNNFVVVIFQLDPRPGLCVSFIFPQKLTVGSLTGRHSPVILILNPITFPSPINRTHLDCWMVVSNHGDRFTFFSSTVTTSSSSWSSSPSSLSARRRRLVIVSRFHGSLFITFSTASAW